jgi:hypothetical protein
VGGIALWTTWQMQQILIDSPKQNIEEIAQRLPGEVEVYSEMYSLEMGLLKAISNRTTGRTLVWVKHTNGNNSVESLVLSDKTVVKLMSRVQSPLNTRVYEIGDRYFVICGKFLQVKGQQLGLLFVAQDISYEQKMFSSLVQSLGIVSLVALIIITIAVAIYIKKSLQPLRRISQLAETYL